MRPSRSSTRLAVPAFHDSYGPRYIRERPRKRESCRSGPIRSGVAPGGGRRSGALYLLTHYVEDGRSDKRDETPQTRGWRTRDGSAFGTGKGDALSSERFSGEMPGVPIGTLFSNRQSLPDAGVHLPPTKMMNSARTKLGREKLTSSRDLAALLPAVLEESQVGGVDRPVRRVTTVVSATINQRGGDENGC